MIAGVDLTASITQSTELEAIAKVYELSGHPINMPYTDVAAICNALFQKDVHSNVGNGVEFSLAVHCVGYPGKFVSVHVFLASLIRS